MNNDFFEINYRKAQLYYVQNNGSSIDNFVINFKTDFKDIFRGISVKHCSVGVASLKELNYGFKYNFPHWEISVKDRNNTREYSLKILLDCDNFPFKICNEAWVSDNYEKYEKAKEEDFNYNIKRAYGLIADFLKKHTSYFKLTVYCGTIPSSSWPNRCYIKVITRLQASGVDVFELNGATNLTEFGKTYIAEIKNEFSHIVDIGDYNISKLFRDKKERQTITRLAENNVRKRMGIKNVGEEFVNETQLANITKKMFPDTIRQYKPKWLGKFAIDIFVPSLNLAVEYNGEQHYIPVERYGGQEKLDKQQERDAFVRKKCEEFNILLLEWHYEIKVTASSVYDLYSKHVDLKNYKSPLTLFD